MLAAILAAHPVPVTVGGETYTIPPMPARAWLLACLTDYWTAAIIPGLLTPDDHTELLQLMLTGHTDDDEIRTAAHQALTAASGRTWWETMRLIGTADAESGGIAGELLLRGVDADRVTLAGWCAAVYTLITRGMEPKDRSKFDMALALPPAGEDPADHDDWDAISW